MSYPNIKPKIPEWTSSAYQEMGESFSRSQWWVKIFTVITGLSVLLSLLSFNIVGIALSGMVLYACLSAWKSLSMFEEARSASDVEEGLEQLKEYLKWQTLSLGIGFAFLALAMILTFLAMILLFFLA